MPDTVAGQTQVLMNGMLATLPHVQSGQLNVLGVSKPGAPAGKDGALVCAGVPGTESGPEVSIMPAIPAANTNLPTIMVAERCAGWFRETALTS